MKDITKTYLLAGATLAVAAFVLQGSPAYAITTPVLGDFAYDLYDIGVNKVLKGPAGFVGGIAGMVMAAILLIRQQILPAAATVLGSAFLLKADAIITSLGALVN